MIRSSLSPCLILAIVPVYSLPESLFHDTTSPTANRTLAVTLFIVNSPFLFLVLIIPRLYIRYRQTQTKKITENPPGESFAARFLAWILHTISPHQWGVFLFSLRWGVSPPKPGGGTKTISPSQSKMYHLNLPIYSV